MRTIFNRAKRTLKKPHYCVVFNEGGLPDYRVGNFATPRDERDWQQKHLQGGDYYCRFHRRPVYLINIYGKGRGWL